MSIRIRYKNLSQGGTIDIILTNDTCTCTYSSNQKRLFPSNIIHYKRRDPLLKIIYTQAGATVLWRVKFHNAFTLVHNMILSTEDKGGPVPCSACYGTFYWILNMHVCTCAMAQWAASGAGRMCLISKSRYRFRLPGSEVLVSGWCP